MIRYSSTCSNTRFNNILCDVVSLLDLVLRMVEEWFYKSNLN